MTPLIHPLSVRITHWINALSVLIMTASGLQIHNAYPIAPFAFPTWLTLGDWLGGALLWHFAAMWVFAVNLVAMLAMGLLSGRYRRRGSGPSAPRALLPTASLPSEAAACMPTHRATTTSKSCSTAVSSLPWWSWCCPGWRSGSQCSCRSSPG